MPATWYKLVDQVKVRHDGYIVPFLLHNYFYGCKTAVTFGPFIQDKPASLITSSFFCSNFDRIQITMSFRKYALVKMTNKEKVE